nr:hypothetical protein [Cytophagales bacterium]
MTYETYTRIWYDFISCGIAFGNGEPEGPDFRQGGGVTPGVVNIALQPLTGRQFPLSSIFR